MKTNAGLVMGLALCGCGVDSDDGARPAAALAAESGSGDCLLVAHLTGQNEVPPRDTDAVGQVVFRLSADRTTLSYTLIAANIDNVIAAHIHIGAVGVNGPIVVFLAGNFPAGGGATDGILASGTITSGIPVADMLAGNTYVNVHTNDGVDPSNTGPGDFPGGEIRGQVVPIGHGCQP